MGAYHSETISSYDDLGRHYREELDRVGTIMLPAYQLFSREELAQLEQLCAAVPEEVIRIGDAGESNDLYVGRFMVDYKGTLPARVNQPHADRMVELLQASARSKFFRSMLGAEHFLRRCQINRMVCGSYIGHHLDVDSNPDYVVSVVIQLGRAFEGGEFVVYPREGEVNEFRPQYGTVIVSKCIYPHEVKIVTKGERSSLVYFYSMHAYENRRSN